MSYEYSIQITDEPLTEKFIQNEYSIDDYRLITILEYENRYCYFEGS